MFCRQVCPTTHILIAWADFSKWFFTAVKIMSHKTWVTHVHRRIHKTFITFISNENQEIQKSNFHESYCMTQQKKIRHNWRPYDVISILVKKNQNTTVWWRYIAISCIFSIGSLAPPGGQPSNFFADCNSSKYWLSNEIWLIHVWLIAYESKAMLWFMPIEIWRYFVPRF